MVTQNRHGAQNAHDTPSKQTLENEFGTQNEDEVLVKILEGGIVQETEVGFLFLRFFSFSYQLSRPSSSSVLFLFALNCSSYVQIQSRSCIHERGERVKANQFVSLSRCVITVL